MSGGQIVVAMKDRYICIKCGAAFDVNIMTGIKRRHMPRIFCAKCGIIMVKTIKVKDVRNTGG
jgi:ribosomal protein S27AE